MAVKIDFEISRGNTINVGDYESIKPFVGIKIKDVPMGKVKEVYSHVSDMIDDLYDLEVANSYANIKTIRNSNIDSYVKSIIDQDFVKMDNRLNVIMNSIETLCKEKK